MCVRVFSVTVHSAVNAQQRIATVSSSFPEPPVKSGRPNYMIHQAPNSPYSSQMTFTNYFLPFLETAFWILSRLRHAHCHVGTNKLAVVAVTVYLIESE